MADGLKKTLSHTAIYGIGNALQRIVGFLMLPIYTRYLSPADYGVISMMQILLDLTSLFFGMQIATAVFRHYYKEKEEAARKEVLSTALGFVIITKGAGALLLSIAATPASFLLFGDASYSNYVGLFAFALLTDSLGFIPFQYIRIRDKPYLFVSLSVIKLAVQLSMNIWFIIVLGMGVMGVIYSSVLSGALIGGAMAIALLRHTGWRISWRRAQGLIGYSWPLIGAGFLSLYLTAGNRVVVSRIHGLDQLGLLALASQIALVMRSLVWQPFNQVWGPKRFQLMESDQGRQVYERAFVLVTVVLVGAGAALAVFAEEFIEIMSASAFHDASRLVPVLVLAETLRCMTLFSNTPLLVADRTIEMLKASLIAAGVFTFALVTIVPYWGAMGAAVAAVINAVVTMWWVTAHAREQGELRLPWNKFFAALSMACIAVVFAELAPEAWIPAILVKTGILLCLLLSVYLSPVIVSDERRNLEALLGAALSRISRSGRRR